MASAKAARLQEVEALRQARLEAQAYAFQLEQAHNELEHLHQHVAALERQQHEQHRDASCCSGGAGCAAAEALQEARLQAADSRYKLQLTELELAKQLDALQELQWQLECVVAQLGLAPPASNGDHAAGAGAGLGAGAGGPVHTAAAALQALPAQSNGGIDHMLLLGKVEELRQAQLQLGEYKCRLAAAEAQLDVERRAGAGVWQQQRQQHPGATPQTGSPGVAVPAGQGKEAGLGSCSGGLAKDRDAPLGEGGRQLVGELLQENEALRQQLAEAEERYHALQRDLEVELLLKADAQEEAATLAATGAAAAAAGTVPCSPSATWRLQGLRASEQRVKTRTVETELRVSASWHGRMQQGATAPAAGVNSSSEGPVAGGRRTRVAPVSESMETIARQRLGFRLAEKDKQLAKMREVVRELECKLIEAHKRQADLVMKESSWREQEAQDRRIAQLEDEHARLQFAATAAQAEAEAARKEALAQRRLVKRLQDQAAAAAVEGHAGPGANGSSTQMVELLQKRVKVLEAQNIRLRLQAKSSKEEEQLAAAEAAAEAARAARAQRRGVGGSGSEQQPASASADGPGGAADVAGENNSPNRAAAAAAAEAAGEEGSNVLEVPFARWEADKRLQKRVEVLQTRLREKTTALVSAEGACRRAEEKAEAAQAAAQQAQAALAQAQSALRQAEQRSLPGTMVPVAHLQELLTEVEQLQQRYDDLERRHAALQHRVPARGDSGSNDGPPCGAEGSGEEQHPAPAAAASAPAGVALGAGLRSGGTSGCSEGEGATSLPEGRSLSTLRTSGSGKAYRPGEYGGSASNTGGPTQAGGQGAAAAAGAATQPDGVAQLLEKEVALFDAQLQRDQAVADAERHRRRLHALLDRLSPHPHDAEAAATIAEARQLVGLPPLAAGAAAARALSRAASRAGAAAAGGARPKGAGTGATASAGAAAAGAMGGAAAVAAGGSKRRQPSGREQELLDTIALLKAALERTKKGLESGVTSSKYMAAVERAKQLKAQCQALEAQLEDAARVREELSRVQQQLGALHGTASALRSQLKAAKEQREEAASAREHTLRARISELERTLRERDAQMEALNTSTQEVDEEVRVLVAEGLRPADLIQELLVLRPRVRELEGQNAALSSELAGLEEALARDMAALQEDHELLRRQCSRWEGEIRGLCARHGEPLPLGLV